VYEEPYNGGVTEKNDIKSKINHFGKSIKSSKMMASRDITPRSLVEVD
jgi:hypothetical protein